MDNNFDKNLVREVRIAIQEGNTKLFKEIIKMHDGLINVKTFFGTLLHDATNFDRCDIVKYLIDNGLDVNIKGSYRNSTALVFAAFNGNLDILKLLYENGAIFDEESFEGNPLFAAIYNGHFEVVKFLVDKGINLDVHYAVGDFDAIDAYEYARQYGRTEIANYLKEKMGK